MALQKSHTATYIDMRYSETQFEVKNLLPFGGGIDLAISTLPDLLSHEYIPWYDRC